MSDEVEVVTEIEADRDDEEVAVGSDWVKPGKLLLDGVEATKVVSELDERVHAVERLDDEGDALDEESVPMLTEDDVGVPEDSGVVGRVELVSRVREVLDTDIPELVDCSTGGVLSTLVDEPEPIEMVVLAVGAVDTTEEVTLEKSPDCVLSGIDVEVSESCEMLEIPNVDVDAIEVVAVDKPAAVVLVPWSAEDAKPFEVVATPIDDVGAVQEATVEETTGVVLAAILVEDLESSELIEGVEVAAADEDIVSEVPSGDVEEKPIDELPTPLGATVGETTEVPAGGTAEADEWTGLTGGSSPMSLHES